MGQKSSKKVDLYITDNVTHCNLPDEKVKTYIGRPREYTAIDVNVENGNTTEQDASPKKKKGSSSSQNPHSILTVLSKAHRKSYHLAFVIPKVKGSKPSTLVRNSFIEEETNGQQKHDDASAADKQTDLSHTIFLLRPKVKSRLKKEFSLKRMEATKTFLNVMLDIQHKWGFSVKQFSGDIASIATGKYMEKLQDLISSEASKGGRLLSVMRVKSEKKQNNGLANGSEEGKDAQGNADEKLPNHLTLQMVFLHKYGENVSPSFQYTVTCHQTKCTEQALNLKKKQPTPKSSRNTNITWTDDWMGMFKDDSRLTEVIYVGEQSPCQPEALPKSKKAKPRQFEVCTLCFYEKPIKKSKKTDLTDKQEKTEDEEEDTTIYPEAYDGMIREVWAPIDDNIQASLENEASTCGEFGWELCTVLVTSHVRMKSDGSEFRKCAIFFQRPKSEHVPEGEMDKSRENLLQDDNVLVEGASDPQTEYLDDSAALPSSPKEKVERFGIPMLKVGDLDLAKLKSTSKIPSEQQKKDDQPANTLPAFQLKKVDREKIKKPEVSEESTVAQQVKLRPTETKEKATKKDVGKEVPWMTTLEKKREAVMKREESTQLDNRPKSGEADGEIAQKIDQLKEKRAERQHRLSNLSKESMEMETGDTKDDKNVEDVTEKNSEDPVVIETIPVSTEETCEKETTAEGTTETDKAENDIGCVEKSSAETTEDRETEANDAEINGDVVESISTDVSEHMPPSSPFKDLPSPPPVVTPQRGNETAISHLHLPSPPPVTDDLSPSEEGFPYPPNVENESQETDNSEKPNQVDNEVTKEVVCEESVSIEKEVTDDFPSDVLDFPIPPPTDLSSPTVNDHNPTKEAVEDNLKEINQLESCTDQSIVASDPVEEMPKMALEDEKETQEKKEKEDEEEANDRAEVIKMDEGGPILVETDTTAAITEVTSSDVKAADEFPPPFLGDTIEDKLESPIKEIEVSEVSFNDTIPQMDREENAVTQDSESKTTAQLANIEVTNTTENVEENSKNNILLEDTVKNSSQISELESEENLPTKDSINENIDEANTPPPSPHHVEEEYDVQVDSAPGDIPNEQFDNDGKEIHENDKNSLDDLKEPTKEEAKPGATDDSQNDRKNGVESDENKNLPETNDDAAEQGSTNILSNEGQAELKEASEDSSVSGINGEKV